MNKLIINIESGPNFRVLIRISKLNKEGLICIMTVVLAFITLLFI